MNLSDYQSGKVSLENKNEKLGQSDEFSSLRMSSPHPIPDMLKAKKNCCYALSGKHSVQSIVYVPYKTLLLIRLLLCGLIYWH
jgi:hypothetical protein